jgi:hypothetical protein
MGLTRSYVMLNTFLFGIFGQFEGDAAAMSRTGPLLAYRNGLFDAVAADNPLEAVLTVGSAAKDAISRWPGRGELPTVHVFHPAFPDVAQLLADWNEALVDLAGDVGADDGAVPGPPYGTDFAPGDVVAIPRHDLPFGLPPWHGDGTTRCAPAHRHRVAVDAGGVIARRPRHRMAVERDRVTGRRRRADRGHAAATFRIHGTARPTSRPRRRPPGLHDGDRRHRSGRRRRHRRRCHHGRRRRLDARHHLDLGHERHARHHRAGHGREH